MSVLYESTTYSTPHSSATSTGNSASSAFGSTTHGVASPDPTESSTTQPVGSSNRTSSHPQTVNGQTQTSSPNNMTTVYAESETVFTMSNASISTTAGHPSNSTADTTVVPVAEGTCYSQTTLFIIGGSSGGAVLSVVIISLICCCCLRHKWRKKLSVERERTDIWSMRTFNNTIINDNFMDYQLASSPTAFSYKPTSYGRRKSSGISEHSVRIIDPYSRRSSRNTAASVENISDLRLGNSTKRYVYDQRHSLDDSTLRRNTYSAPGGLDGPDEIVAIPGLPIQTNHACNSRERALTYSAGKRHKQDRHVLLVHEEYIEDDRVNEFAGDKPNNPYIITEL